MTNQDALFSLRKRGEWIESRIAHCIAIDDDRVRFFERDRDVNAFAIAAIEFVIATEEYEASQKQL